MKGLQHNNLKQRSIITINKELTQLGLILNIKYQFGHKVESTYAIFSNPKSSCMLCSQSWIMECKANTQNIIEV